MATVFDRINFAPHLTDQEKQAWQNFQRVRLFIELAQADLAEKNQRIAELLAAIAALESSDSTILESVDELGAELDTVTDAVGETSVESIAFTDGETWRRVTILNPLVTASSRIHGSVRRPNIATSADDSGHFYVWAIVLVSSGSFDLVVAAFDYGMQDCTSNPPNETIQFIYQVTG